MKSFFAIIILCASSAFASPENSSAIEGTWKFKDYAFAGLTIESTLIITNSSLTANAFCTMGSASSKVTVIVPALIEANKITPSGSAYQKLKENGVDCEVGIDPVVLTFEIIDSNTMKVIAGSESALLTRVN